MRVKYKLVEDFIHSLGSADPNDVAYIEITPERIVLHVFQRNVDGTIRLNELGPATREEHFYVHRDNE